MSIESLMSRRRPASSVKTVARHVQAYVDFLYDIRSPLANDILPGEGSVIVLRDFRCPSGTPPYCTSRRKSRSLSLSTRSDALGVSLPLGNPTLAIVTASGSDEPPRQAPSTELETTKKLELISGDTEVSAPKRLFAATIVRMTYTRLRLPDV